MPMFHVSGAYSVIITAAFGSKMVMMPNGTPTSRWCSSSRSGSR